MRELAAALAKKCKRTKPKTEKENKVSEAEADSQLAAISYPNRQSVGAGAGAGATQVSQEPEPLTDHAAAAEVAATTATRTTAKTVEINQVECIIRYALLRNWISSTATPHCDCSLEIMAGMQLHLLHCCRSSYNQMTYF